MVVPGTHHSMLRPPAVRTLADVLLARLEEAEGLGAPAPSREPTVPAAR